MSGIVGIDVGGTFTDLYFSRDGITADRVIKVPSTPDDPSRGLADALLAADLQSDDVGAILHGTTIATNAVIERSGAKCALLTTHGFRDVLELGRRDRQHAYGLTGVHAPLVPRALRYEVMERMDHHGNILTALNEDDVRAVGEALKQQRVEAIVVSFLHAYANPLHEERAKAVLRELHPEIEIVIASSVVREYFEFERTSTAVVQGYLQPLVSRYAHNLQERLAATGFRCPTLIMQSNGGLMPIAQLAGRAANIVRSGPAAGVIAAARIAAEAGFDNIITADMGGTSYDVAVVIHGHPRISEMTELDFRIPLRLPMIDVHTIGAGGGSVAFLDRGGTLQVGPRSAGAFPGPVCFGRGGTEPTVADANAILGRINPENPIGLKHLSSLDIAAARLAMGALGTKIGLSVEETALAVITLVNHRMAGRTRLMSVEHGYDPRDFALVVFGGAGPLHGAAIMKEVGIRTMLIPPQPGVLCAYGCAIADLRYDMSQTVERPVLDLDSQWVAKTLANQSADGAARVAESDVVVDHVSVSHAAEMSYVGQIHSLRVEIQPGWDQGQIITAFEDTYRRQYGNVLGNIPILLVSLITTVRGVRARPVATLCEAPEARAITPTNWRLVHFDAPIRTPVYQRTELTPGVAFTGPAIVEQSDTTSVIEPDMKARVDSFNNILVEVA
jgi:N-methylhydantoinase A